MKKFFTIMLMLMLVAATKVSAEQEKADEYRKIFSSDTFYVEYDDKNVKQILAEKNGQRMSRTTLGGRYATIVSVLNPIAAMFQSGSTKYPEFLHSNGKYYKFAEKDYATMIEEDRLDDENLNPKEGWSAINKNLSLPDELAVFNWKDKYHVVSKSISEPVYATSMKKVVNGTTYDCDRYASTIKMASGRKEAMLVFDMLYQNGELVIAQSAIFANDKEYEVNKLIIKKISNKVPDNEFKVYEKAKVYSAGQGDMNDLLEIPVFVGKFSDM